MNVARLFITYAPVSNDVAWFALADQRLSLQ